MPELSNIIILNIPAPLASLDSTKPFWRSRHRLVALTVGLLRLFGFRFTTVSDALRAPPGRYACLTLDAPDRTQLAAAAARCARLRVPATVFVAAEDVVDPQGRTPAMGERAAATLPAPGAPPPRVTWTDLRTLIERGWEIGTCGVEPVNLADRSHGEQRALIAKSRKIVASGIGQQPRIFAYPFGAYDATTVSLVRQAGFRAAVTLKRGTNSRQADAFHLKRWSLADLRLRDLGGLLVQALSSPAAEASPLITTAPSSRPQFESGALL